jgi:hypothetical protein
METHAKSIVRAALAGVLLAGISPALAQEPDQSQLTRDKKADRPATGATKTEIDALKMRALQTTAIMNLRQIGLALFEFETEYNAYPNRKTAADVKELHNLQADLSDATANDCFYQLIAAKIVRDARIFTLAVPDHKVSPAAKPPGRLEKCAFSYLAGMTAAGDPSRILVVAPLVKGKKVFDRELLGGKAVILRTDNSVQTVPIDGDGRVMIDGKDLFDPTQPFWNGKVPEIRWPKD